MHPVMHANSAQQHFQECFLALLKERESPKTQKNDELGIKRSTVLSPQEMCYYVETPQHFHI